MLGHVSYDHAFVWVQLQQDANVKLIYKKNEDKTTLWQGTQAVSINSGTAFTNTFQLDELQANTSYIYQLIINEKETVESAAYHFKTPPLSNAENIDFNFAMGSCVYINDEGIAPKGGDYQIFESIAQKNPNLMFWLGDNIYLHEKDWHSKQGIQYRYTHARQLVEMRNLLVRSANYAIWDDHDYGPNDSDRSFIGKENALEVFHEFWANPTQQINSMGATVTSFSHADCDFFLLDNRYWRSPQKRVTGERTILGKEQADWLIDALCTSEATFKFVAVGGLVLSSSFNVKNQNYISNYHEERTYLLKEIEANNIKNVIFLTGDKHFGELSKMINGRGNSIWEITSSPLTASPNTREDNNSYRIPGSHIQQRNFAFLEIEGKRSERKIKLTFFDSDGKELWNHEIQQE
ncbi:MAG: alkaline phosphatase D family protein [Bacteroidota bacterium]